MEDVQQLARGQGVVISGGLGCYVNVHPLVLPDPLIAAAQQFVQNTPAFTPLPPPAGVSVPPPKRKKIAATGAGADRAPRLQPAPPGSPPPAPVRPPPRRSSGAKSAFPQTPGSTGMSGQPALPSPMPDEKPKGGSQAAKGDEDEAGPVDFFS